jgi:RHS repeat-associated protein
LVNFAFDSRNRLTQAGSTTYRYDAENQRIGVNQTQLVVNSQPNLSQVLVKEENGVKTFYVYGLGLIGEETGSKYTSYHFDLRGSTVALTNSTGQVTERFQYSPYGVLLSGNAEKTPFLFNGMYGVMTDSNDLYYMRARFYSPEMRRFVNQDILLGFVEDGQTLNRYAFVTGDPVSYVDPFGLDASLSCKENGDPSDLVCEDGVHPLEEVIQEIEITGNHEGRRPFVGFASDKTLFFFLGGLSHQTAIIYDLLTGKRCITSTYCAIPGIGLYLGISAGTPLGIAMEDIEKSLAGLSISLAGEVLIPPIDTSLEFSCGIDKNGITSLGSARSFAKISGVGGGAWVGIPICFTKILTCF